MKTISFIGLFIMAFIKSSVLAQTKTDSAKVSGNCSMCKQRIEAATTMPGVSKARWDVNSKRLTVSYNSKKIDFPSIQKKIAASGHDSEQVKANDEAYNKLPECCKYERSKNYETKAIISSPGDN